MKLAIVNLGHLISGNRPYPFVTGDTMLTDGGRIARLGTAAAAELQATDLVMTPAA